MLLLVKIRRKEVAMDPTFCEAKNSLLFRGEFSEIELSVNFLRIDMEKFASCEFVRLV